MSANDAEKGFSINTNGSTSAGEVCSKIQLWLGAFTDNYADMTVMSTEAAESGSYDDPQAKMWSLYISEAEKFDRALADSWKDDMDGILIFVSDRSIMSIRPHSKNFTRQVYSPPS